MNLNVKNRTLKWLEGNAEEYDHRGEIFSQYTKNIAHKGKITLRDKILLCKNLYK